MSSDDIKHRFQEEMLRMEIAQKSISDIAKQSKDSFNIQAALQISHIDMKKVIITEVTKRFSSMRCDLKSCFRKIPPGVFAYQVEYEMKGEKIKQIICQQCKKFIVMDAAHEQETHKKKKGE